MEVGEKERRWFHGLPWHAFLVFALALVLRLEHLAQAERTHYPEFLSFLDDASYYAHESEEIAAGRIIGDHSFFMGPLYPYTLAGVSLVMGLTPILETPATEPS